MPRAITVQQPWASALFHGRPVESRTRKGGSCPYPQIRPNTRLLIHAGATWHPWAAQAYAALPTLPAPDLLPRSGIIGSIHVVGWYTAEQALAVPDLAPWVFPGDPERWYLRHDPDRAVPWGVPLPCPGALGVWDAGRRVAVGRPTG